MVFTAETEKIIDKLYNNSHVELTIGILKDGKKEILHLDPDRKPTNTELKYPVGSIGKPFTASLIAKYVSEGKLRLDAPLSDYIPNLSEKYYPDLRRLATHSSGYGGQPFGMVETLSVLARMNKPDGYFRLNPHHGRLDEKEIREILEKVSLKDKDYKFRYSNFGFAVLGFIIGTLSGKGYWETMNNYVRDELGLKNTYLGFSELLGYDKHDMPCNAWSWDKNDGAAPAGALISTADDLLSFASMQMDGSKPYMSLCHKVHGAGEKNFRSGLAWRIEKDSGIIWHGGSAGAYSGFLGFEPETKTAVVTAVNYGLADAEPLGFSIIKNLIK